MFCEFKFSRLTLSIGTKSKHMQEKEQAEDEELLDQHKDEAGQERRFSGEDSEVEEVADVEGAEAERLKRNILQVAAYDDDVPDAASEASSHSSGPRLPEAGMDIEDLNDAEDSAAHKNKTHKIDIGGGLNSFKPMLRTFSFVPQQKTPELTRAKVLISIRLNLEAQKNRSSKILMLSLVENIMRKVLIRSVKGITKSYVIERKTRAGAEKVIQTEGINFEECFRHPEVLDLARIESNNIREMMKHYGIEAARHCIVKEVRSVFAAYGIEVDYRHLSLVADFMTQNGTYRPFNRIGMQDSNSVLLKASFETSTAFLSESCSKQEYDDNTTPSSAIVLGQIPKIGTGVFDLLME